MGNLIAGHPKNLDALASKVLGEGPQEPALNSILRIILRTSSMQEFVAADYVFKCFCEVDNLYLLLISLIPILLWSVMSIFDLLLTCCISGICT